MLRTGRVSDSSSSSFCSSSSSSSRGIVRSCLSRSTSGECRGCNTCSGSYTSRLATSSRACSDVSSAHVERCGSCECALFSSATANVRDIGCPQGSLGCYEPEGARNGLYLPQTRRVPKRAVPPAVGEGRTQTMPSSLGQGQGAATRRVYASRAAGRGPISGRFLPTRPAATLITFQWVLRILCCI
jgi:hypothetical protein